MVLLCKLTRLYSVSGKEDEHLQEGINKVLEYLNIHFREKIKVDSLSKSSRMSRSNFLRVFKLMTGVSPLQYVLHLAHQLRLPRIAETRRGITEIAYDSGFEDSNYFSRTFRKFIGMTPREYRLPQLSVHNPENAGARSPVSRGAGRQSEQRRHSTEIVSPATPECRSSRSAKDQTDSLILP